MKQKQPLRKMILPWTAMLRTKLGLHYLGLLTHAGLTMFYQPGDSQTEHFKIPSSCSSHHGIRGPPH